VPTPEDPHGLMAEDLQDEGLGSGVRRQADEITAFSSAGVGAVRRRVARLSLRCLPDHIATGVQDDQGRSAVREQGELEPVLP